MGARTVSARACFAGINASLFVGIPMYCRNSFIHCGFGRIFRLISEIVGMVVSESISLASSSSMSVIVTSVLEAVVGFGDEKVNWYFRLSLLEKDSLFANISIILDMEQVGGS